jgi:hypothetical protein
MPVGAWMSESKVRDVKERQEPSRSELCQSPFYENALKEQLSMKPADPNRKEGSEKQEFREIAFPQEAVEVHSETCFFVQERAPKG